MHKLILILFLFSVLSIVSSYHLSTKCKFCSDSKLRDCKKSIICRYAGAQCFTELKMTKSGIVANMGCMHQSYCRTSCDGKCDGKQYPCCECCSDSMCNVNIAKEGKPQKNREAKRKKTCDAIQESYGGFTTCDEGEYKEGDECFLYCMASGYTAVGDDFFTCTGGNWSPTPGVCLTTCPPIKNPVSGLSTCNQKHSYHLQTCDVTCNQNYTVIGIHTLTCNGQTGKWDKETPTCESIKSERASNLKCYACQSTFSATCSTFDHCSNTKKYCMTLTKKTTSGLQISKKCASSFDCRRSNADCTNKPDGTYTCFSCCEEDFCNDGEPSPSTSNCPAIPNPTGGSSTCSSSTSVGNDVCTISCDSGYTLTGNGQLNCNGVTGEWDVTSGICYTKCPAITSTGGTSTCSSGTFSNSDPCTITCGAGYKLNGTASTTCDGLTGNWSPSEGTCISDGTCTAITPTGGTSTCSSGTFSHSISCDITCGTGYTLNGIGSVTCNGVSGQWEPIAGTCEITGTCKAITLTGGTSNCASGTYSHGTSCKITCGSGYTVTGTDTVTCGGVNGTWAPDVGTCEISGTCSNINLSGGVSNCTTGNFTHDSSCVITCGNGYELNGSGLITCNGINGTWGPSVGTCEINGTCSAITETGGLTTNCNSGTFSHNASCTISCDGSGYTLKGTEAVTCNGISGTWEPSIGTCEITGTCQAITLTNGTSNCVSGTYTHDTSCKITCGSGYTVTGTDTVTCDGVAGIWSPTIGTCRVTGTCPSISPIGGISSCGSGGYTNGTSCNITCSSGYSISGTDTVTCVGVNGTWVPDVGTCEISGTCPNINPSGGASNCTIGNFTHDSSCVITCDSGYALNGTGLVTCNGINGTWGPSIGTCEINGTCSAITEAGGLTTTCNSGTFSHNISCTIECDGSGYTLKGTNAVTCNGIKRTWEPFIGTCEITGTCSTIIPNGGTSTCNAETSSNGNTCKIECSSGYTLNGNEAVTCNGATETWEPTAGTCVKLGTCPAITPIAGILSCSSETLYDEVTCTVKCGNGYAICGTDTATCDGNSGTWIPKIGTCEITGTNLCSAIPNPVGGSSTCSEDTAGHGTKCTITCNSPYTIMGNSEVVCNSYNSSWTPTPGGCYVTCPAVNSPYGGSSSCSGGNTAHGESCRISCSTYHTLIGNEVITCNGLTGKWDVTPGTCSNDLLPCPIVPNPLGGVSSCSTGKSHYDRSCTITCNEGYAIDGNKEATCNRNHDAWVPKLGTCYTTCKALPNSSGGSNSCNITSSNHDTICEVKCASGYILSGNSKAVCNGLTGQWTPDVGVCVENKGNRTCHQCEDVFSNHFCKEQGVCGENETTCFTTVETDDGSNMKISKGCVPKSDCNNMKATYDKYNCFTDQSDGQFKCSSCCSSNLCNDGLVYPTTKWSSASSAKFLENVKSSLFNVHCFSCKNEKYPAKCEQNQEVCSNHMRGCQTITYKRHGVAYLTKSCRNFDECLSEKYNLSQLCTGDDNSLCFDCCKDNYCNIQKHSL